MVDRIKAPSRIEFEIFDAVWGILNENQSVDENLVVKTVAGKYKRTVEQVDKILNKVLLYKEQTNETMFQMDKFALNGKVYHYGYEPTNDMVSTKIKYKKGKYNLTNSQRDFDVLQKHVFGNMLKVKTLVVGAYDHEDRKIVERIFHKKHQ